MFASFADQRQYLDSPVPVTPDVFRLDQGHWVQVKTPVISQRRFANISQFAFVSPEEFWGVGDALWWTAISDRSGTGYIPTVTPLIVHYASGPWDVIEK
jgi:hypothetical protein